MMNYLSLDGSGGRMMAACHQAFERTLTYTLAL